MTATNNVEMIKELRAAGYKSYRVAGWYDWEAPDGRGVVAMKRSFSEAAQTAYRDLLKQQNKNFYTTSETAGNKLHSIIHAIEKSFSSYLPETITPVAVRKGISNDGKMQEHWIDGSKFFGAENFVIEFWSAPDYPYVYIYCKGWDAHHEFSIMTKHVARELYRQIRDFNKEKQS